MLEFKTINQFQRDENETQNNFQNYTETLQRQWLAYTNIRVSFELRFADRNIYIQSTGIFYNKNCKEKRRQRQTFEEVRTSMHVDHRDTLPFPRHRLGVYWSVYLKIIDH